MSGGLIDPGHLRAERVLLAVTTVAVPGFGFLVLWLGVGGDPDFVSRFTIAATAAAIWAASYRSAWVRRWLRPLSVAVAAWVFATFMWRAADAGVSTGHAMTQILICALTVTLLQHTWELVAYWVFVVVMAAVAYRTVEAPLIQEPMFHAVVTTIIAGMGFVSLARYRLQLELQASRDDLERRVVQRTAELHAEVVERRAAEADALRASRAKSAFLANMSHELRTPLTAVVGFTELVQDELVQLGHDELVADLDNVRSGAEHLQRMIADVLDLSRIEAGELEVVEEPVRVAEVVAELVRLVQADRKRSGSTLEVRVAEGLVVHTDRVRVAQVALNLLTNALKFTEGGTVVLAARCDDDQFELSVTDSGIGIAPDHQARVFERFAQVDSSSTRRQAGTGLGLALSRELAERLGGTLTVVSELGVGSTFTLRLPAPTGADQRCCATVPGPRTSGSMSRTSV